ncbi:MAG: hypothetical protein HFI33_04505 [Lachnospiraceae bacterium]|nr:hypothetical protein [Lachnospiraceae bacterium]
MEQSQELCIPCLLRGISNEEYEEVIRSHIRSLEEDVKVSQEVYGKRLQICSQCEFLRNGYCRLCGCFVEIRAIKKWNQCADEPPQW